MNRLIISLLIIVSVNVGAQNDYKTYNWNTFNDKVNTDNIKPVNGALIVSERKISEIYINSQDLFEETFVFHRKIKVDTHDAINKYNKIYISLNSVLDIIDIAARFISPNGKITELPKSNIKQIDNLETYGNFKTFVIEGAETGGQIEYYYVLKKSFNPFSSFVVQDETPRAYVNFIFSYPSKVEYLFRYNNGFPAFEEFKSTENQTRKQVIIQNIPGIPEERYALYNPNMMGFDFVMAYNNFNSPFRTYSWNKACDFVYNNMYTITKKEKDAVAELLSQIPATSGSTAEKIRCIENWIKSNFKVDKNIESKPTLIDNIKLRQCNFNDISKLYISIYNEAGINFEYVKTGDNTEQPFQPDFNAFNYLDYSLLYFPEVNQYITPENDQYRLGITPAEFQGEYGLFMKPISYKNTINTLGYEIKQIPVSPCTESNDSLNVHVTLDLENNLLKTDVLRKMYGDFARSFQAIFHLMDDTKKTEMVESLFEMGKDKTDVLGSSFENTAPENIAIKPLIWNIKLQSKTLIEEAGNDIVVRIGETIGRQSELYQEGKRFLPVSVGLLHSYFRKITMKVPDGYKVENMNDLNMNVEMKFNNKVSCAFRSTIQINNNLVTIISTEYYTEPAYPAEEYDNFRKVINAAADFNKKNLILKKI